MGLMRMIAGAAVVGGIVWWGEGGGNPVPAIATAGDTAREAVVFCQTYPALCRKAGEAARERVTGSLSETKATGSARRGAPPLDGD